MRRKVPALFILGLAFALMAAPSHSNESNVELTPDQPYVDVPFEATTPSTVTITTNTGSSNRPGFVDSWVELWQASVRLAYDDDGGHSVENVLASRLVRTIEAGFYFVRATSFSWAVSNGTQTPTGDFTLSITGVTIASPTPTPTPTPSTEPEPTESPAPTPTPSESATPEISPTPPTYETPTPTPQPAEPPTPEPGTPQTEEPTSSNPAETTPPEPTDGPQPEATEASEPTEPADPQSTDLEPPLPLDLPADDPSLPAEEPEDGLFDLALPDFSAISEAITETFAAIGDTVTAAAEAFTAIGSDMSEEQRETSQTVVISAVIVTQIQTLRRLK